MNIEIFAIIAYKFGLSNLPGVFLISRLEMDRSAFGMVKPLGL